MVVPMFATSTLKYFGSVEKRGIKVAFRASPQSGPTMTPATTYVTKTQLMASRTFSMR